MCVGKIDSFPINKRTFNIEEIKASDNIVGQLYPEIFSCIGCNACTKGCPQGLNVMQYIAYAQRGEYEKAAHASFDCVGCNICASRCPAQISHSAVGLLCRRLTGKYIAPKCEHLAKRVAEIENGDYVTLLEKLKICLWTKSKTCITSVRLKIRRCGKVSAFTEDMLKSMAKVEATRAQRLHASIERFTAEEKDELLKEFHPDYSSKGFKVLEVGPNKGQKVPVELAQLLEGKSRLQDVELDLEKVDYDVDVLVIGGGGAGASAALEAHNGGANVLVVTKLRMGDANTMMAEGGIQAADKGNDSPAQHYLDAFGGGHYKNIPELLEELVTNGPLAIDWLSKLGVMFDKEQDGTMVTTHGGGTSRKRMHACADYTGAEIMRVLRDEVQNRGIPVLEFSPAVELLLDEEGKTAGAVLWDFDAQEYKVVRAKCVIMATGGAGRLHYQGFPTSNHYGATADGLVMAYRAGAPLIYADAIQYHPTGVAYPAQIYGALVTERCARLVRSW